ncbi:SRPBCC family protein [Mycobacterium sp.]|uniref:SRPBCC family protein n=1 Tax=Mycobacterium sp. TaxID=1785 RepID=UPI0039C9B154
MNPRRTKSQTLSESIRIAAPPDRVWDLITTVAGIAEWYDTWDAVEHAAGDQRLQVGTSFRLIRHRGGRDDTALCRVTSLQPRRRLCWVQSARQLPTMSVEFRLVPETDGAAGTWVNHTRSWLGPDDR